MVLRADLLFQRSVERGIVDIAMQVGQPAGKPQAAPTYYGDPEPEPGPDAAGNESEIPF